MKITRTGPFVFFLRLIFVIGTLYVLLVIVVSRNTNKRHADTTRKSIPNRVEVLTHMCKEYGQDELYERNISMLKNIVVNDKYKLIFCYVPKVACSNFLRLFLWMNNIIDMRDPLAITSANVHILKKNLTHLGTFSQSEMNYRLKHYKKAVFVRDPLVRLISAYRNKFVSKNPYFMSRYGRIIIQRYRNSSFHNGTKYDIKFSEFLQYLIDERTIRHGYEDHWKSFNDLCHPCLIRYNFIGKYESIDQDVEDLLKMLNIQELFKFPTRDEHYKHALSADLMSSLFQNIEPYIFERIVKVYLKDYTMFNYTIPSLSDITNV